jgi:hypothetical protein
VQVIHYNIIELPLWEASSSDTSNLYKQVQKFIIEEEKGMVFHLMVFEGGLFQSGLWFLK